METTQKLKRSYSSHTKNSVQKMKSSLKKSVFTTEVLTQGQYKGKFDRVKLYNYLKEEWKKTPILNRKNPKAFSPYKGAYNFGMSKSELDEQKQLKESKINAFRMKNLKRPMTFYKKEA